MLAGGDRQIADNVQRVPATGSPTVDHRDDYLRHRANQPLDFQDVQPPAFDLLPCGIDAGFIGTGDVRIMASGITVSGTPPNSLVTAGAEGPTAIFRRRPVARQQHRAHVGAAPGVVECSVELVDGVWAERVAHLGAVEGDAHDSVAAGVAYVAVVGDVGQVGESVDGAPLAGVERVGLAVWAGGVRRAT